MAPGSCHVAGQPVPTRGWISPSLQYSLALSQLSGQINLGTCPLPVFKRWAGSRLADAHTEGSISVCGCLPELHQHRSMADICWQGDCRLDTLCYRIQTHPMKMPWQALVVCDFAQCGTEHPVCQPDRSPRKFCCLPGAWICGVAERMPWLLWLSVCFSGSSSRHASVKLPGKAVSRFKVTVGL